MIVIIIDEFSQNINACKLTSGIEFCNENFIFTQILYPFVNISNIFYL